MVGGGSEGIAAGAVEQVVAPGLGGAVDEGVAQAVGGGDREAGGGAGVLQMARAAVRKGPRRRSMAKRLVGEGMEVKKS